MAEWYDNQNMGSAFPLLDYGTQTIARNVNNALPNNQNNSGLAWWMQGDRSRYPSPIMPKMLDQTGQMGASNYQDLGNATVVVDENRIPGRIQKELPTNIGFSFNPLKWGIGGMMKKIIEPNTPEENFGREYFKDTMDSSGRIYNDAGDLFGGKLPVSAFGQGMGAAGQKRLDKINETLSKWESDEEKYAKQLATTSLYDRRKSFQAQLDAYKKALAAATGGTGSADGATIPKKITNVVTTARNPNQMRGGDGASRDQGGGYTTRGGFTGTRGQEPGTRGGATSGSGRGHHSWRAEGGRVGYREGELVDEDINIEGPGFDINEQVAGYIDPQDALNDMSIEIFGKPLHQLTGEEYQILIDMANDQAMGEQDQGIASLV